MTTRVSISRRNALAGAALFVLGIVPALAAPMGLRLRAISVDAAPLAAKGVPRLADSIRRAMVPALAEAFAGLVLPGDRAGVLLRVSIDSVDFASDGGGYDALTRPMDYLHATGTLVGGRGEILGSYPLLAALVVPGPVNANFGNDLSLRTQALARYYAGWLRKEIGG